MHVLIAPNSFKNSLDAASAAEAIREGLLQSKLDCTCACFPVGDGGDGTAALLIKKWNAEIITTKVHDPLWRQIDASYGIADEGKTAIIEMADASGIRLLKREELSPLYATSFGTGELIKHALDNGVNKIILCIGGSATVDGGTGILQALGFRFVIDNNETLNGLPASLINLTDIDTSAIDKRILNCELIILCDVENQLLGEHGAARVFGPQKGATLHDIAVLEQTLAQFNFISLKQTGKDMQHIKHGGAAGGVAAGLSAWLNAKLANGIDYFLDATHFDEALKNTDLLITGEGSIDVQTLHGKAPYGVAKRAKEKGIPVIGLAGKIPLIEDPVLKEFFDILLSINNDTNLTEALLHTKENLVKTAKALGDLLSTKYINEAVRTFLQGLQ